MNDANSGVGTAIITSLAISLALRGQSGSTDQGEIDPERTAQVVIDELDRLAAYCNALEARTNALGAIIARLATDIGSQPVTVDLLTSFDGTLQKGLSIVGGQLLAAGALPVSPEISLATIDWSIDSKFTALIPKPVPRWVDVDTLAGYELEPAVYADVRYVNTGNWMTSYSVLMGIVPEQGDAVYGAWGSAWLHRPLLINLGAQGPWEQGFADLWNAVLSTKIYGSSTSQSQASKVVPKTTLDGIMAAPHCMIVVFEPDETIDFPNVVGFTQYIVGQEWKAIAVSNPTYLNYIYTYAYVGGNRAVLPQTCPLKPPSVIWIRPNVAVIELAGAGATETTDSVGLAIADHRSAATAATPVKILAARGFTHYADWAAF
jgi:hypothetical protein